jgi:hypothetical protein
MSSKPAKTFRGLPFAQAEVFEQICVNLDTGHNARTLAALVKKGLITERIQRLSGSPPVDIKRYSVPLPIHMEWCEWCSTLLSAEDVDPKEELII